jgi:hypothetical protein
MVTFQRSQTNVKDQALAQKANPYRRLKNEENPAFTRYGEKLK